MTGTDTIAPRAFAVWWNDLERWAIPTSVVLRRPLPKGWKRVLIGTIVRQVTEHVKVEPQKQYKMAGVRWYGEGVFHRETVHGDDLSASQVTPLIANALIYNRLFAWKASFAVVPPELVGCYVSSEFPQFVVNADQILVDYLYLLCTRDTTIRAVNAASTGSSAVSRNRFRENAFLRFEIALPPLSEQENIVSYWRRAKARVTEARKRIDSEEGRIPAAVLSPLGIPFQEGESHLSKRLVIQWKDLERWSISYLARSIASASDLKCSKYPLVRLGDLGDIAYGIAKSPMNRPGKHARPYLRVANVQKGELDLTEIRKIEVPDDELQRFRLLRNDLLVCEGNSADLVGRPAIWNDEIPNCVHQNHILRVRVDDSVVLPRFLLEFMHTQPARNYFRARAKFTTNLASINSTDLRDLRVPLPPLAIQARIVQSVARSRSEIADERKAADDLALKLNSDLEDLILRITKAPDL
jgi:type I restriction enzyme, S subunit